MDCANILLHIDVYPVTVHNAQVKLELKTETRGERLGVAHSATRALHSALFSRARL